MFKAGDKVRWAFNEHAEITVSCVLSDGRYVIENGRGGAWFVDADELCPKAPETVTLWLTYDSAGNVTFSRADASRKAITGLEALACQKVTLTVGQFDD